MGSQYMELVAWTACVAVDQGQRKLTSAGLDTVFLFDSNIELTFFPCPSLGGKCHLDLSS